MSLNLLIGAFLGLWIGMLADRSGPRMLLAITIGVAGAGFALAGIVQRLWHLYLFVGVMAGVGMSGFYVLATATVARWFTTDFRGLAMGLVLTGFNLGFMTGPPVAAFLIEHVGWRTALALLGGFCCVVGVAASIAVRFPPGAVSSSSRSRWAGLGVLVPDWRLWALGVSWLLTGGVMVMLTVHVVPFARDQGIRLEAAALGVTAYGIGAVIGRVAGGIAADRLGTMPIMWVCYAVQALALVPLLLRPSSATVVFVLAAFGIGFAAADTVFAKVVPDVFGLKVIGAVFGLLTLAWRCGAAAGPAAAGFFYDLTGSYLVPFAAAPLAVVLGFVLFLAAGRHRIADRVEFE